MILAVASGKGGTGKTTVALNLARAWGGPVQLLDCDVEEPNVHLFLELSGTEREIVSIPVPEVDESLCDGCGECGKFCQYHAIVSFGTAPLIFAEMCHGCGGCALVCPRKAIREIKRRIGAVETARAGDIVLIQGRLDVGSAMAPPLIREVKARMRPGLPAILDAPPGTSCPVVATLRGADFAALVTEPTPFGLHDLELAVETVREIGLRKRGRPGAGLLRRPGHTGAIGNPGRPKDRGGLLPGKIDRGGAAGIPRTFPDPGRETPFRRRGSSFSLQPAFLTMKIMKNMKVKSVKSVDRIFLGGLASLRLCVMIAAVPSAFSPQPSA